MRKRSFTPQSDPDAPARRCDVPGCQEAGEFRAPRSRHELNQYYWFCLEHVREYNRAWNYFDGLNDDEVEQIRKRDIVGERPTWPLGWRVASRFVRDPKDVYGLFEDMGWEQPRSSGRRAGSDGAEERKREELRDALAKLDLTWPVTFDAVKSRYKELAKRLHPDVNGGDAWAEERLKVINQAYGTLKANLGTKTGQEA